MTFGDMLASFRQQAGLTLREFAQLVGSDASNISKIERGVLPPPPARIILNKWALNVGLTPDTRSYNDFIAAGLATTFQRAAKTDEEITRLLPVFCRTIENKRIDPQTYKRLIALLRQHT